MPARRATWSAPARRCAILDVRDGRERRALLLDTTRPSLLERLRDGEDQSAWQEFDDRYRELILRYGRRSGLQPADAQDVRQMVMLSLSRALPNFVYRPELGRFRDYLGASVRNAIRKHRAKRGRAGEVPLSEIDETRLESGDGAWVEAWNEEWMLHHYRRAMKRVRRDVSEKSLAIFEGLLDGATVEELAETHGTSTDAVYKVKQRMRDRLKDVVAEQLAEEEFQERDG